MQGLFDLVELEGLDDPSRAGRANCRITGPIHPDLPGWPTDSGPQSSRPEVPLGIAAAQGCRASAPRCGRAWNPLIEQVGAVPCLNRPSGRLPERGRHPRPAPSPVRAPLRSRCHLVPWQTDLAKSSCNTAQPNRSPIEVASRAIPDASPDKITGPHRPLSEITKAVKIDFDDERDTPPFRTWRLGTRIPDREEFERFLQHARTARREQGQDPASSARLARARRGLADHPGAARMRVATAQQPPAGIGNWPPHALRQDGQAGHHADLELLSRHTFAAGGPPPSTARQPERRRARHPKVPRPFLCWQIRAGSRTRSRSARDPRPDRPAAARRGRCRRRRAGARCGPSEPRPSRPGCRSANDRGYPSARRPCRPQEVVLHVHLQVLEAQRDAGGLEHAQSTRDRDRLSRGIEDPA